MIIYSFAFQSLVKIIILRFHPWCCAHLILRREHQTPMFILYYTNQNTKKKNLHFNVFLCNVGVEASTFTPLLN